MSKRSECPRVSVPARPLFRRPTDTTRSWKRASTFTPPHHSDSKKPTPPLHKTSAQTSKREPANKPPSLCVTRLWPFLCFGRGGWIWFLLWQKIWHGELEGGDEMVEVG